MEKSEMDEHEEMEAWLDAHNMALWVKVGDDGEIERVWTGEKGTGRPWWEMKPCGHPGCATWVVYDAPK